jgi:hypothetical protein
MIVRVGHTVYYGNNAEKVNLVLDTIGTCGTAHHPWTEEFATKEVTDA